MTKVTADDLIGSWRLQDWSIAYSDGRPTGFPYGTGPDGLLIYAAEGFMSAVISAAGRPRLSDENVRRAPAPEKAAAFDGYFHYAGTWRLDGARVVHRVEFGLNPNFVGTEQVRELDLDGDRLTLSARATTASGAEMLNRLVWRRLG